MSKKVLAIVVVVALALTALVAIAPRFIQQEEQQTAAEVEGAQENSDAATTQQEFELGADREHDYTEMLDGAGDEASRALAQILQGADWVDESQQAAWTFDGSVLKAQTSGNEPTEHEFKIVRARYSLSGSSAVDGVSPMQAIVVVDGKTDFLDLTVNDSYDPSQKEDVSRFSVSCDLIGSGVLKEHRGVLVDVDFMDDSTIATAVGDRQGDIEAAVMEWCESYAPLISEVKWTGTSLTDWSIPATAIYFTYGTSTSSQTITVLFGDKTDKVFVEPKQITSFAESEHYKELRGETTEGGAA